MTDLQTLLETYQPSEETVALLNQVPTVLLVGISGAGKDTIRQKLLGSGEYYNFVSHTTRAPRQNDGVLEQDGEAYHFITLDKAVEMIQQGKFIEAKHYSGNVYGTSVGELEKAAATGKVAINDVEIQGVSEYKELSDQVIAIFLLPPSYAVWKERLASRYDGLHPDQEEMRLRIETAAAEVQAALDKNYYHFVINDSLDDAVAACFKITHSDDKFFDKDHSSRLLAEQLLHDIKRNL